MAQETEQAIDQTLRIAPLGAEYSLRIGGAGAKHLTAGLWASANTQQKTRAKARKDGYKPCKICKPK